MKTGPGEVKGKLSCPGSNVKGISSRGVRDQFL